MVSPVFIVILISYSFPSEVLESRCTSFSPVGQVRKRLTTLALSIILVIIGHAPACGAANPERVDMMGYPHARHATFSEVGAEEHLHGFAMRTCPQHLASALGILLRALTEIKVPTPV